MHRSPARSAARLLPLVFIVSCGPCEPEPFVPEVTSGATTVAFAPPFSLVIRGEDGEVGRTTSDGALCAPLLLALRADDDIDDWHKPDTPNGDEIWLAPTSGTIVKADPLTVDVAFGDKHATVTMTAGAHGFVDIDVVFDVEEVDVAYVGVCFALAVDEHAVGGGERFDGPDLRGKITPLYFGAPGQFASSTNEAHVPVPFFATSRGLGVWVETERVGAFDMTSQNVLRFHGKELHLRVRAGAIVENVAAHARREGLPPPPPRFVHGAFQWRNDLEVELDRDGNVLSSGTDMLRADMLQMITRALPFSSVWIDAPWETGYNTFVVNDQQLPDLDAALTELDAAGFRVLVWATEHLNSSDDSAQAYGMPPFGAREHFRRFQENGWLVRTPNGSAFEFPWGRGVGGHVDFSNPAACAAYQELMRPLLLRGIRGFKLDYGETMRPDVLGVKANDIPRFFDGSTTSVMHTRYARLYHECYIDALRQVHGDEWFIITRTGGIYDQKNGTTIWPGDLDNGFENNGEEIDGELAVGGLPAAVAGYLSLAMSGYPLYGSDVGGYRGGYPTREAFARWAQFGAVSTVMQVGGGGNQAPWDPQLVDIIDIFAEAARLHMDLWPMWQAWLARATSDGTPVAVPVGAVANTEDAWADVATFVLGDSELLVAPVIEDGARERTLFVPSGRWLDWWTREAIEGPGLVTVAAPLERLPLFLSAEAIVVLGHPRLRTLLDNGPAPGGYDDAGDFRIVRTAAGGEAQAVVGDVIAHRFTRDGRFEIDILSDVPRPIVIDVWGTTGTVKLDGDDVPAAQEEEDLLVCDRCAWVEADRVRVRGGGRSMNVAIVP